MQKMIFNVCLFFLMNLFAYTINAIPHARYPRQILPNNNDGLPYGGWGGGSNNPSGGSPGAYYGTGVNPNYGAVGPNTNDAHNSINAINYNNGYNSNWNQQQQQYSSTNNNYNNRWQTPNMNNYYNRPNNRYPPGSQGWYAAGGNYWQNKGQSVIPHTWLLIISVLILIIRI